MDAVRALFVRPPVDVLHKFSKPVECLALGYLASAARASGHDVELMDGMMLDWTDADTVAAVVAEDPDVVGFTVVLNHLPANLVDVIRRMRSEGFRGLVLVGGHAVSFVAERILDEVPEIDAVVVGEGERAIADLLDHVAAGSDWRRVPGVASRRDDGSAAVRLPVRARDLDAIPWPARDLTATVIDHDGLAAISTSRGCYARCTFCSVPRFYGLEQGTRLAAGSWIARSVDSTVAEMAALKDEIGLAELLIVDDEFFGGSGAGHARAAELGRQLTGARLDIGFALSCRAENVSEEALVALAAGGLRHVFVGVENGAQSALKLYGKGHTVAQNLAAVETIKSLGLSFQAGYMMFNHRSTLAELAENIAFLREIGEFKPVVINSALDPHFGTPVTTVMERDRVLQDSGLRMTSTYIDARVATCKLVAERCAAAFVPYMNLIAGLSSSVTYEWRRAVPGRRPGEARLIEALEHRINAAFASILADLVHAWLADESLPASEILDECDRRIAALCSELDVARAIVLSHIARVEGSVRYWTQRAVLAESAA